MGLSVEANAGANPIRKVVNLLQEMQKRVAEEGEKEKDLYDKFMCYCTGGNRDLTKSISDAETRHELDEAKYEKVAEEEMQYQGELQTRLEKLRASQRLRAEAIAATATASSAVADAAEEDEGDEDSGSDVEFDWRAKGFG